jgi:hypothetical protein
MDKFDELLKQLQELEIEQDSVSWEECIPVEIWKEHFEDGYGELESGLDVNKHRWYETSTSVVEAHGRILGIHHVSNIYSESMSCEDCGHTLKFFEMKEIKTTSFTRI